MICVSGCLCSNVEERRNGPRHALGSLTKTPPLQAFGRSSTGASPDVKILNERCVSRCLGAVGYVLWGRLRLLRGRGSSEWAPGRPRGVYRGITPKPPHPTPSPSPPRSVRGGGGGGIGVIKCTRLQHELRGCANVSSPNTLIINASTPTPRPVRIDGRRQCMIQEEPAGLLASSQLAIIERTCDKIRAGAS